MIPIISQQSLYVSLAAMGTSINTAIITPVRSRDAQSVAKALIYRVIYLFGPPRQIICDEAVEFHHI